jgi:pyridoxine 4-dehydrogenase
MNKEQILSAAAAGTFTLGGDLTVNRMGYGAMRITGEGVWGPPADKSQAILMQLLCRSPWPGYLSVPK